MRRNSVPLLRRSSACRKSAGRHCFCEAVAHVTVLGLLLAGVAAAGAAEPPAINPFGKAPSEREDAVPGYVELSDGSIHPGMIYLTRDKRLQIYDEQLQRQREVPLQAVKQIECSVKREWMEREWRFKETTSDEKVYTGRSYPAREYLHTITLKTAGRSPGRCRQSSTSSRGRRSPPKPARTGRRRRPSSSCSTSATRANSARS